MHEELHQQVILALCVYISQPITLIVKNKLEIWGVNFFEMWLLISLTRQPFNLEIRFVACIPTNIYDSAPSVCDL